MSINNESSNPSDWCDFSVTGNTQVFTGAELYKSYQVYKERFNSLPKSE